MSFRSTNTCMLNSIPDVDDIRQQTAVAAAINAQNAQKWHQQRTNEANQDCIEKLKIAANRGLVSANCSEWVSRTYIAALELKGYHVEHFEGDRDDPDDDPYYRVSWDGRK